MATTFRADITTGVRTMMDAFITANGTSVLARHEDEKPTTFALDMPLSYLSSIHEDISHTSGTRERVASPTVTVVAEAKVLSTLVDLLVDHFTAYPHVVAGTIWDRMTLDDDREEIGDGGSLPAVRFTFTNLSIREGRT